MNSMVEIGDYNVLIAYRRIDAGMFLIHPDVDQDEEDFEKILLPNAYLPDDLKEGDPIQVFVYLDSEDRIIATNLTPKITVDSFACLMVKDVNTVGAFLDMGLAKDLLVPFRQQASSLLEGKSYVVFMYLDETTNRLIASTKLNKFLSNDNIKLLEGEQVDLLVMNKTDLGYNVIVDQRHKGLVFHSDIFQELKQGDSLKGYVKTIRPDNKLDIVLHQQGTASIEPHAQAILDYLKANNGSMSITDKSSPDVIYSVFQMSKKAFKKAMGSLYKKKLVDLHKDATKLL